MMRRRMAQLRSVNLFASRQGLKSHPVRFSLFFFPYQPRLRIPCGLIGLEIMAPVSGKSAELAYYKLYGVLYHHGESTGSGRYSVDVLHLSGDGGGGEDWLHIDDEAARTVRHEDVFGDHHDGHERVDDPCAYMLFYCRTAPTGPTRT
jgi:hypothetical protein